MTSTATATGRAPPGKTYRPPKNRVGGFSSYSETRARFFVTQPLESHRGKTPTPTTTASGMRFYGYRYYAPNMGRWLGRDPQNEIGALNVIYKDVLADLRWKRSLAEAERIRNANQNPPLTTDILAYLNQKYRTEFVLPSSSPESEVLMVIMAVDPNLYLFVVNNPAYFVDTDGRDWWPPSKWPIWPKPGDPGTWPIPGKPTCKKVKICGKEVYLCYWKNPDPDPQPDDPKVCCWISIPW